MLVSTCSQVAKNHKRLECWAFQIPTLSPFLNHKNRPPGFYVDLLKRLGAKQSMSRKGNCWDNAKAESFFSHYKCETIHIMSKRVQDVNDVQQLTKDYMD